MDTVALIEEEEKTTYETERDKPIPSVNHAIIQGNLVFFLKLAFRFTFR